MAGNENSGRKLMLDETLIKEMCKAKKNGLSNRACCDYIGIDESTLYDWLNKGDRDTKNGEDSIYSNFSKRFKKAISEMKAFHIGLLRRASEAGSWQASAWILERCFPKEYGRNIIVKDETSNGVLDKLATALEGLCEDENKGPTT